MSTNVLVPALGESVSEAVLLKWHKRDGEQANADEPLCELETEKANVDVPSPGAGVFTKSVSEGSTVRIGQVIGTIDESAKGTASSAAPARVPPPKAAEAAKPPPAPEKAKSNAEDLSPAVRRM